ncbi:MAG: tetratricopeptide repeat protein [bacterium]|nr:tetratricopeptide repeat protein [bacterium]
MLLKDKRIKNLIGLAIIALVFGAGIVLWTGPLGEFFLKQGMGPRPELFQNPPGGLTIRYPWNGTLFPPAFPAPTFAWHDSTGRAGKWLVVAESANGRKLHSSLISKPSWRPSEKVWARLRNAGLSGEIRVSVYGVRGVSILSGSRTVFRTSPDSVAGSIFYRAVPVPFSYALQHLDSIRWHLGDAASAEPAPALLKNMALCGNCHSFSKDGKTLAMDVDYANDKGSYVISGIQPETDLTPEKVITWSDYRREDGRRTFGLLSQISPDGRFALSTVKDRSIFVPIDNAHYSQLFFPVRGILAWYDRETKRFGSLAGADDPELCQSNPVWSPDGKWVYFCRTRVYRSRQADESPEAVLPTAYAEEFISGRVGFKYDVYRVPFNGGKGGRPEPLAGASGNGMSNYFPRPSPDGRWIVFAQAKNFMLLQPDSKLWIVPVGGGTPRLLACNTDSMNSWHSWSPDGKWLAFASKIRGPHTDVCLTHIDSAGNASPPVILERFAFPDRAVNIPEFVNLAPSGLRALNDKFTDQSHYWFTIGKNKMGEKKYNEAVEMFDRALRLDSTASEAHVFKGHVYTIQGEFAKALAAYEKAVSVNPADVTALTNRGSALYHLKEYGRAIASYDEALRLDPKNAFARYARGSAKAKADDLAGALRDFDAAEGLGQVSKELYLERGMCRAVSGQMEAALADFNRAAALDPNDADARVKAGNALFRLKRFAEAEAAYTAALKIGPGNRDAVVFRAACRSNLGRPSEALEDYDEAIRIDPSSAAEWRLRGLVRIKLGDRAGACGDFERARSLGLSSVEAEIRRYCGK